MTRDRKWPEYEPYDDARDIQRIGTDWLRGLSTKALKSMEALGPGTIHRMIKRGEGVFARVSRLNRDILYCAFTGREILLGAERLICLREDVRARRLPKRFMV